MTRISIAFVCLSLGLALSSGCATSYQARTVEGQGFLSHYDRLHEGGKHQAAQIYVAPGIDWKQYDKILVDPVTIWRGTESRSRGLSHGQAQQLADYFRQLIVNELSKHWQIVPAPGKDTLRVSVALTKLDEQHLVLDIISSVVPQARGLNTLQHLATGQLAFVGSAAVEMRMTDAETGRILVEGMDRRIGKLILSETQLKSWGDVENVMQFWADRVAHNLCTVQDRSDCPPLPKGA